MKEQPVNEVQRTIVWFVGWITAIFFIWWICGCSTMRKSSSVKKTVSDSVVSVSIDSSWRTATDSTGNSSTNEIKTGWAVIEFNRDEDDSANGISTRRSLGPITASTATTIIELPGGGRLLSNKTVKSVTMKSASKKETNEEVNVKREDGGKLVVEKKTKVHTVSVEKDKEKHRVSWWGFAAMITMILIFLILWRRFFKKRKE